MTGILHSSLNLDRYSMESLKNEFKQDILAGLSKPNKSIPSKYFYDETGSELFNQITRHPDYYLTKCELEILNHCKNVLSNVFQESFNLIELGPGEGIKTEILIHQFLNSSLDFTYTPIDISKKYLTKIIQEFNHRLPQLKLVAINEDFFQGLNWMSLNSWRRNVILFLGSSIGNFNIPAAQKFLMNLHKILHNGDYILIGFDLRKDPSILLKAYDDSSGITRDFNLNLLKRINSELGGNFKLEKFEHKAMYNDSLGAMESYLVSKVGQEVYIDALNKKFPFGAGDKIHVESSYKYLKSQIDQLANHCGFTIVQNFSDSKNYFIDSLWQVKKP